jgi:hypothetical protein
MQREQQCRPREVRGDEPGTVGKSMPEACDDRRRRGEIPAAEQDRPVREVVGQRVSSYFPVKN